MRRPIKICLAGLAVVFGFALLLGGPTSGMSPLSISEARTVIGGGSGGASGCQEGMELSFEAPPGTGCNPSPCLRISNVFSNGSVGSQLPEEHDCPNHCGTYYMTTQLCGT